MTVKESLLRQIGWREWLALPDLGIEAVKAKIDTGARTSCLHAFFIEPVCVNGIDHVRFGVHPVAGNRSIERICLAPVRDVRSVSDSGGHREKRWVIETTLAIGPVAQRVELTLANRDTMRFRMLLGRSALQAMQVAVNPLRSYLLGPSLKGAYPSDKRTKR
ncbi:MAG: ATP-dependent zinc protease [Deltaproteobacteria bacterium]|nr:MAG: ATP-dependent zinc protease [Deltaproteobacteria bacterium]